MPRLSTAWSEINETATVEPLPTPTCPDTRFPCLGRNCGSTVITRYGWVCGRSTAKSNRRVVDLHDRMDASTQLIAETSLKRDGALYA